ncbi:3-deoxy-D-manno-octulosonic acid kinase [Marinobacter sp. S0848L]|uniref:3-deoxy-D-manno-octulosonic acid kinase n=1 Tax=Marinobacter sp. S0848L TaxID=2926423 RepID=UPI001FF1A21A|nr:3-deoxy-D-manno-octulosonic acid kinase [Marinobacter sp. S0848L]MCK0107572.1 3-deoxy-D-manno-octulosonic acid kinase [Marinobacter sp. S0848L]
MAHSESNQNDCMRSAIISAPGYESVDEHWFLPQAWGRQAHAVTEGGRGSAWFIESECGSFVLRYYRRGGLAARLSDRRYLFTGFNNTRSFAEFRLTDELYQRGLPVPKPVSALACRFGSLTYEAAILVERIPGARSLPTCSRVDDEVLWHHIGKRIGAFHQEGLDHVDLNCDNILITDDRIYLIDFDRCKLRVNSDVGAGWKHNNLKRLYRSICKRLPFFSEEKRTRVWNELIAGYHSL